MTRRNYGFFLLLLFPIIGLAGMTLVLTRIKADQEQNVRQFPTPAPIRTTLVPTITVVEILGAPIPEASLTGLDGEPFSVADLQGRIVILNFWATWCPPCVEEMPLLQTYALDHPELVVLEVTNPDDGQSLETIRDFIAQYRLDDLVFALDQNSYLQLTMRAMNLPTTFVLDQNGIVRFRQIGPVTQEDLDYYVGELR